MKRYIALLLIFVFAVTGCQSNGSHAETTSPETTYATTVATEESSEATTVAESSYEETSEATEIATEEATEPTAEETVAVTETVYAVAYVGVRSGPGMEYEQIGTLNWGQTVERLESGDNGWSKVIYNDTEAYISSGYLSLIDPATVNTNSGTSGAGDKNTNSTQNSTNATQAPTTSTPSSTEAPSTNTEAPSTSTEATTETTNKETPYCNLCGGGHYISACPEVDPTAIDASTIPCSLCGDTGCAGKSGGTCPLYDITKDSTYFCQTCGKSTDICIQYVREVVCSCGQTVPAFTCHSH